MLENVQVQNPKQYWKLISDLKQNNKDTHNIDIHKLFDHYKDLNNPKQNHEESSDINNELGNLEQIKVFSQLDFAISNKEVQEGIKLLKKGKSHGPDLVKNEMLKSGQSLLVKPLTKIFNLVLNSGQYPKEWSKGRIISIHKKGDPNIPANYRGITISSVIGKLFNSILNIRLLKYLDENDIMCPEQSGFRKKHRTTDHMFILKNLMKKYKAERKCLYIVFVDFKQAFDSINHSKLCYKLLKLGISNRFYNVIKSMYSNIMLSVQTCDKKYITKYFKSIIGVRQGDNLSPTLFNMFVNDVPKIFDINCEPAIYGNMKIHCMMYADDLLILSESSEGIQESMNKLQNYCTKWGLQLNIKKTKLMMTMRNNEKNISIKYMEDNLESVTSFKYLGVEFHYTGDTNLAKKDLYNRASKAYFKLLRSMNPIPKPHIMLHLFDHLIKPILLYGCEVWSPVNLQYRQSNIPPSEKAHFNKDMRQNFPFITKHMEKVDPIEKLHLKYCKRILGVNIKSTNMAVYSELGRYPLFIDEIQQCIKYTNYIELESKNLLLKEFYQNMKCSNKLSQMCNIYVMKKQLQDYISGIPNKNDITALSQFKNNMKSSFNSYWHNLVSTKMSMSGKDGGNKLRTYKKFKSCIKFESYLNLNDQEKRRKIAQIRISAHKLKIETDRFNGKNQYKAPELRTCDCCNLHKTEDEFHFIMECPKYKQLREHFFSTISFANYHFRDYNMMNQFIWIMTNEDHKILSNFGQFLISAWELRLKDKCQNT